MDNIFVPIQPLYMWTQMAVPTVFTPELTAEEQLGKMLYKLNEVVAQLNNVPGLIDTKITEAFDQSGIEEEIKEILSSMQLSVKNPPEGVPAAKGDGTTNDTAAINGLINYANNMATQTGIPMAVLIPTGNYAVTGLQLKDNVSLMGEDMYNTVIKVMDYTNAPAIIGSLGNAVIGNFTLDGNSANNAANFIGAEITASGPLNMSSIRFTDFKAGDTALSLTPNAAVQISTLRAESAPIIIEDGTDIVTIEDALLLNCPVAALTNNNSNTFIRVCGNKNLKELVINNGDNCYIIAFGGAATDNSTDSRVVSDNMDKLLVGTLSLTVLGGMALSADSLTDTVTGARTLTSGSVSDISNGTRTVKSGNVVETVTAAKTVNAASETVTLTGKQTVTAHSRETTIADADTLQAGSLDVTVDGALETMASSQTQTVTNIMDVNYGDLSEGIAGDKIVTVGDNSTETVGKSKTIEADALNLKGTKGVNVTGSGLKVLTTDPLTYNKPLTLNDHYNYVPMIDTEGNTYQILVFNGTDPTPEVPESHLPTYINVKELGAKGDGTTDDTAAFQSAAGFSGFIFVPAGTYLITSVTMLGGIKGIIGEMSTIKSSITSGNMLTFTAAANLAAIILDAAGAENAVSSPNGININQSILNGNLSGPINMTACSVNNNSQLSCTDNSRILGSRVNGNIALAAGVNVEITGNAISGSFVFVLSAGQKIGSLAVTGNVFNPAVTISDANITTYRAAGNVGLADYPVVEVPEPTPAFNYRIPVGQSLLFETPENIDALYFISNNGNLSLRTWNKILANITADHNELDVNVKIIGNNLIAAPLGFVTSNNPTEGNAWKIIQWNDGSVRYFYGNNGYLGPMSEMVIITNTGQFQNIGISTDKPVFLGGNTAYNKTAPYIYNQQTNNNLAWRYYNGNTDTQIGLLENTGTFSAPNAIYSGGVVSTSQYGGFWIGKTYSNSFGFIENSNGNVEFGYKNSSTQAITDIITLLYSTKKIVFGWDISAPNLSGGGVKELNTVNIAGAASTLSVYKSTLGLTDAMMTKGILIVVQGKVNVSSVSYTIEYLLTGDNTSHKISASLTNAGPFIIPLNYVSSPASDPDRVFRVQWTSGIQGTGLDLLSYYVPLV